MNISNELFVVISRHNVDAEVGVGVIVGVEVVVGETCGVLVGVLV
jgi:hypothetical protein